MHEKLLRLGLLLTAAFAFAGCNNPAFIDPGPSFAVRFATERVSPAVVQLDVLSEHFQDGQSRPIRGLGSGVIIDAEGYVLTNFHVAGRPKRIDITLANEEHVRATLVGSDHWTDLAVVKLDMDDIKKRNLSFAWAALGDSDKVVLGQPVMAIGTPHGLKRTVTAGIISNTDRFFDESSIDGYETGWFNNWLQMDAAINPGNSGGPLINLRGEVIGINTRGAVASNNLGFAIPINVAKRVIADIRAHGKVARSYVGIQLQPLQDLEGHYGLAANRGVLIRSVDKLSPAAVQDVQAEDILLAINDQPVSVRFPEQLAAVRKLMAEVPVGATMKLTLQRPGKEARTVAVATEKLESVVTEEKSVEEWGMSVRDLTRAYLRDRILPMLKGVLVTSVRDASAADQAKLQRGDIILRVDGRAVESADALRAAVAEWKKHRKTISIDIRRDRSEMTLVLKARE